LLFFGLLIPVPADAKKHETGFLDRTISFQAVNYKYQVFVPEDWTPHQKWPIILALHGAGERGDDGVLQTDVGIGTVIRTNRSAIRAIVVMPQCRKNLWWNQPTMDELAIVALAVAVSIGMIPVACAIGGTVTETQAGTTHAELGQAPAAAGNSSVSALAVIGTEGVAISDDYPRVSPHTTSQQAGIDGAWHARGYYGHIRHNVKAIYQKYLGWYDANPVNLDPLPPVEAGKKFVEYMGGADAILARAARDFAKGEFRFVAQAVSHLVFAEPDNQAARALLADTFEQLGYAAESATWRNAYLFGAQELRQGMPKAPPRPPMPRETLAALRTEQLWDVLGVRLNGPKAEGKHIVLNWSFTDTNENFVLTLENCALTYIAGAQAAAADAGFTLARRTLDEVIAKLTTFPEAVANGKIKSTGNAMRLAELMALMDEFPRMFEIVEPKRVVVT